MPPYLKDMHYAPWTMSSSHFFPKAIRASARDMYVYMHIYMRIYIYIYICKYIYIYIYIYVCMVTPPTTTRTPLKNTVNTATNAVFFPNPILELFPQIGNTQKNPKIQK